MKLKQLLKSSSLLIGLALVFVAVMTKRETINGATSKAIAKVVFNEKQAEKWQVKKGSIYDGDTLRVVRGSEEKKIRFCGIDAPVITTTILYYLI